MCSFSTAVEELAGERFRSQSLLSHLAMDDTYTVVNKAKHSFPRNPGPATGHHHYDNSDLGVTDVYSTVRPSAKSIKDTGQPTNPWQGETLSQMDQAGYNLITEEDDYEYVSNTKEITSLSPPGNMRFNCRIKKPRGPRDPPAEWSRLEREIV